MSTRLENISRTSVTFNLTREIAPLRREYERVTVGKDGVSHRADKRVIIPDSVTLSKGEKSIAFPDNVVKCPEVAWRIRDRILRAIVEPDAVSAGDTQPVVVAPVAADAPREEVAKVEASKDQESNSPRRRGDRGPA